MTKTRLPETSAHQLIEAFKTLKLSLEDFSTRLTGYELPCYFPPAGTLTDAAASYLQIWHSDQGDGRRTEQFHGVIAVPAELIEAALTLNATKAEFQSLASDWNRHYGRQRNHALTEVLRHAGYARIQLKPCYRQIPVLTERPSKIQFSWYTSGRSIRKITAQQAREALAEYDPLQNHIRVQLDQLSQLPDDTPLAQVQQQAPLIRANISWHTPEGETRRKAFNCALPILIPEPAKGLPEIRDRTLEPAPAERLRRQRSDTRIEPEPFLPSIHVHRYTG